VFFNPFLREKKSFFYLTVLILEDYLPFMLIWKKLVLDFDFGVSNVEEGEE
jgi:hypothetical protein